MRQRCSFPTKGIQSSVDLYAGSRHGEQDLPFLSTRTGDPMTVTHPNRSLLSLPLLRVTSIGECMSIQTFFQSIEACCLLLLSSPQTNSKLSELKTMFSFVSLSLSLSSSKKLNWRLTSSQLQSESHLLTESWQSKKSLL